MSTFRASLRPPPATHHHPACIGMICLARKKRTAVFRQYVAAETAVPVIACAACLDAGNERNYFFAGVARSKSVREADDGIGPKTDEFFTVSIGGMVTVLNTSGEPIHPVRARLQHLEPPARPNHRTLLRAGRPCRVVLLQRKGHAHGQALSLGAPPLWHHPRVGVVAQSVRSPLQTRPSGDAL